MSLELFGTHRDLSLLSEAQRDQFQTDGYLALEDVLTRTETTELRNAVDAAVVKRTADDPRALADKSTYEQSFIQCMRLWEDEPAVRPFTFHSKLGQAAAELLSVPAVRLWQDQALYKEPGGRVTDAHQDQTFWPIGLQPLVSAWIALSDVNVSSGAMAYVPGSHRAGAMKPVDITNVTEPYDILRDPKLAGAAPVTVEATAGTVIFHHGLTVHQAHANTSANVRKAFTTVYIAEGSTRHKAWPVFGPDRDGVGVGELIQGPGMPIAWPRDGATLPPPPERLGPAVGFGTQTRPARD